jgi:hypothetical protein
MSSSHHRPQFKRMSSTTSLDGQTQSKRRRLTNDRDIAVYPFPLVTATQSPSTACVLPQAYPSRRSTLSFPDQQQQHYKPTNWHSHSHSNLSRARSNRGSNDENEVSSAAAPTTTSPIPKFVDSPLTSENIESALCLIDRNTDRKCNTSDELLQAFHDLYRWSRLSNRDYKSRFLHEFVWELSGIPRVLKFLKAHKMGDDFLSQLLQTELPFNE